MDVEPNKQLARQFIGRFTANDVAGALDLLTEDATWWIAGTPDQLPAAGTYSKGEIARLLHNMASRLPDGLKMTVKGLVAEGDKVAMEAESYGELRDGRVYRQQYHFLLTLRDGRISAVKEYLDTQHAYATWFDR